MSLGDIIIEVEVISSGTPTNSASISSEGPIDPNPGNNTANDGGTDLQDPFVDHQANKSGPSPALVAVGSSYDFELSSTNLGNADFFGTLIIEDEIPSALTIDAITENGWSCAPAVPPSLTGPASITCQIVYDATSGPLSPGETTPEIVTTATVTETGPIQNTIVVSTENANIEDAILGNNTVTFEAEGQDADVSADLSISKLASPISVASGEVETFVLTIQNNGPADPTDPDVDSLDVVVTDNLRNLIDNQEGLNNGVVSISIDPQAATGFTCVSAQAGAFGRNLTCNIDVLPVCSGTGCPTVTVEVRPGGEAGTRRNTANIRSTTTADTNQDNNSAFDDYTVTAQADVTVTKTASPETAVVGQDVVYIVTAQNRPTNADGDPIALSTAEKVTITDTLPDDLTFVSAVPSSGSCSTTPTANTTTGSGNNQVICDLGDIANNAQQTVTITVRPNNETLNLSPAEITNTVEVSTSTPETDVDNNDAIATTDIIPPQFDIVVNKSDTLDPVAVNQDTTYQIEIANFGPSAVENVVMTDRMPADFLAFISVDDSQDGVTCTTSGGTSPANITTGSLGVEVECTIAYMPSGDTVVIEILARGDATAVVDNVAEVIAEGSTDTAGNPLYETNIGNNEITHTTTIRSRVDLRVNSKTTTETSYNVGENFDWTIEVENVADAALFYGVADDVEVIDTLPPNMILTAAPSWPSGTCIVAPNNRTFTCEIGEMAIGEVIDITVPSRVTAVSSATEPQTFRNTATIQTSSFDDEPYNNSGFGDVDINWSSISGNIFRDFNDDGTRAGTDTPVEDVELTLTGTDLNGDPIGPITVETDVDGNYTFDFLPEGSYTITRGTIDEEFQSDGQNRAGTTGGLYTGSTSPAIVLDENSDQADYDFAIVPQARIGLAKEASDPTLNADGTFDVTFDFVIENFSREALGTIIVEDLLAGTPDLFGTYTSASPGMARGTYTVVTPPNSACGGAVAGFTGDTGQIELVNGAIIDAESTCDVAVTIRVSPTNPLPTGTPQYLNTATVNGVGLLSGQTSEGPNANPLLSDVSDDGINPDSNDNGAAGDPGEDDPTPVLILFDTDLVLEKTFDTSGFDDPTAPVAGEELIYTYTVRNNSDFNVFDISVAENAPGAQAADNPPNFSGTGTPPVVGAPMGGSDIDGEGDLPDLGPGAVITYTATYEIIQSDIDAGFVLNTATLSATDVYGTPIEDFSDDPGTNDGEDYNADGVPDDPTITPLPRVAQLEVAKAIISEVFSDPFLAAGDEIIYQFVVTNTGNTTVTNVTPVDPGPTFGGMTGTGADLVFDTSDDTDLDPTEAATFTATYTLTATDVDNFYTAGSRTDAIANVASATGTPPADVPLVSVDDDATTGVGAAPALELFKAITDIADSNGNGILGDAGDTVTYDLTVTNTGNTSLSAIEVTDPVLGLSAAELTAPSGGASLAPGESGAINGLIYAITPLDLAQGEVENSASVAATPVATNTDGTPDNDTPLVDGAGAPLDDVTDTSDTLTDPVEGSPGTVATVDDPSADGDDNPTVVTLPVVTPEITITKRVTGVADTNGNETIGDAGDTITYTLVVTNTGTTALADILVEDGLLALSQNVGELPIGESISLTGLDYEITIDNQADREVVNQANAAGDPVATGPGNVPNAADPLVDDTGADLPDVTDLSDTLTEPDLDADGNVEDVDDPNAGSNFDDPTIVNLPATGPSIEVTKAITDVADTNGNGVLGDTGDTITYSFTVFNVGNASLGGVLITDAKLDLVDVAITPPDLLPGESGTLADQTYVLTPEDQAATVVENTAIAEGQPVATDPVTGRPDPDAPLTDDDGAPLLPVSDVSDTLTEPDLDDAGDVVSVDDPSGDGDDNPTLLNLPETEPAITLTKAIVAVNDVNNNGILGDVGDTIEYEFVVTNTGNAALANIRIDDPRIYLEDAAPTPDALPIDGIATLTPATPYVITPSDVADGRVENTADVEGQPVATNVDGDPDPDTPLENPDGTPLDPVADVSDTLTEPDLDGAGDPIAVDDPAADGDDNPTILNLPEPEPSIVLTKRITEVIDINGNDVIGDVGDEVIYAFEATNTGNTALSDVTLTDDLLDLVGVSMVPPELLPGEAAVLEDQSYIISENDAGAGFVENSATVRGAPVATGADGDPDADTPLENPDGTPLTPVTDISDTLTEPDLDSTGAPVPTDDPAADGDDTPTILNLPRPPTGLVLTKSVVGNSQVVVGENVTYSIRLANPTDQVAIDVRITDTLPVGLLYNPGTSTVAGVPATPEVNGRVITFDGLSVGTDEEVEILLGVRVTAQAQTGELVNQVVATDPLFGTVLSNVATAAITLIPESVFDCSAVIGKVFDDRNLNGYQDDVAGPVTEPTGGVSDQSFEGGKIRDELVETDESEPGLPSVRLVTPTGTIITTDEFGRYSLPCAELPAEIGSNFSLKLDPRSLPTGYRVTTENPRSMRLTAGMFTEMNFGAAISRIIDIDLTTAAFTPGRDAPVAELDSGLDSLVAQIADTPSMLRLSYFLTGEEDRDLASSRMDQVEALIRERWRDDGRYRLVIERTIKRLQ